MKGLVGHNSGMTYADKIASKYQEQRLISAKPQTLTKFGGNNGLSSGALFHKSKPDQMQDKFKRRRTAQPNQRQKMIEKIRNIKEKKEAQLRFTLENLSKRNSLDSQLEEDEQIIANAENRGTQNRRASKTDIHSCEILQSDC